MIKYFFIKAIVVLIFLASYSYSQSLNMKMPKGLRLSNQLEYAYDQKRDLEILEDWFQLDYRNGIFFTGIRLEAFQPNDPNPSVSRGKSYYGDIAFKYIGVKLGKLNESFTITAGNFYQLLSRGLILKSYEDRTIRIDNNLFGIKINARYHNLKLTALSGMGANLNNKRKDILHAFDAEYKFNKYIKTGLTFAANIPSNNRIAGTSIASLRLQPNYKNIDAYFEYGVKKNEDIKKKIGSNDFVGKALYGNINIYYGNFSLSGEYKYYDNFSFTSSDGTVIYNTPPSLRQDYGFTLLNRHPSPLDANNEQGFQLSANFNVTDDDLIAMNYGITNTLDNSSYYVTSDIASQVQFKEFFTEWERTWNDKYFTLIGFGYNEELSSNTKNITPVFEGRYYFGKINTIKLTIEHQNTENMFTGENYYTDFVIAEYLRSPKLSLAVAAEIKTSQPQENKTVRKFWGFVRFGYKLGMHTDVSLLVGSRQAGNICIGGVCRYEPEFNGVELKILTRL